MQTPSGLDAINATFGNITSYIKTDGTLDIQWEEHYIVQAQLAFPLQLPWAPATTVSRISCHRLLALIFEDVFNQIQQKGLSSKITQLGGAFSYRPQRSSTKLSTHAWGIAIDLNPETNQQGTDGDMDSGIIDVFQSVGFHWGGNFSGSRKDPMHFQFATNY